MSLWAAAHRLDNNRPSLFLLQLLLVLGALDVLDCLDRKKQTIEETQWGDQARQLRVGALSQLLSAPKTHTPELFRNKLSKASTGVD